MGILLVIVILNLILIAATDGLNQVVLATRARAILTTWARTFLTARTYTVTIFAVQAILYLVPSLILVVTTYVLNQKE
jgi:uncharacterized membrane protein YjjP (DUF1212 family)